MGFLKSKAFWATVFHVVVVGAGAYLSYKSGTPIASVVAGGITALAPSPLQSNQQ